MERIIQQTLDGSNTIGIPSLGVTYHSKFGALAESKHIYLEAGLDFFLSQQNVSELSLLEMGFGTGLNALLTLLEAVRRKQKIYYQAIEIAPLTQPEVEALAYDALLETDGICRSLHQAPWNVPVRINEFFTLHKWQVDLLDFTSQLPLHLIYFDAFDAKAQPTLWETPVFGKLYHSLLIGGVLTTYASKGSVRRAMKAAGFTVNKIPGPLGKWEMVRAIKQ